MRDCRSTESFYLYLEGELGAFERRGLEAHLETCPACREVLAKRRLLHEAFISLPPLEVPPDFALSVMDRLPEPAEATARWLAPLVAGTASLVVGLLGFYLLTGESLSDILVAVSRSFSSGFGRLLPLFAKLLKVGGLLLDVAFGFVTMLGQGLVTLLSALGPEGIGLILGLGLLLSLLLFFGAKRLLSLGEKA
ncbi:MAG: zf-HC2 domain-containing protein [Acidobacteria bacterium]|nr:zf-HC2 domain-containing protein [Acidobacteriota bacterium]MBE3129469.1 zf-HC2 domain-containing protein [Acidobacteriota bacterium]